MIAKAAIALLLLSGTRELPPSTEAAVREWFSALGEKRGDESFGELSTRAARIALGRPYDDAPQSPGPETLKIRLDELHCVSLVEYSDALARCLWVGHPTPECFTEQVEQTRYRDGEMKDYASRLHYFVDWLADNHRRKRIRQLHAELGGVAIKQPFFFMTRHPKSYPALGDTQTLALIEAAEARLSATEHVYVPRERIREVQSKLQEGDILAFVTSKPGILVTHTGYVTLDARGIPRVLHASSHNDRVVISRGDVANYVLRRPERRGVIIARPLPPT